MGLLLFTPVAFLAWFPFVSEFQTRMLFNQAFSRGLQISRILGGHRKDRASRHKDLMIWVPMYYSAYLLLLSAKHCWEMGMDVMNYFLRAVLGVKPDALKKESEKDFIEQAGFIVGRNIIVNIFIVEEVINFMKDRHTNKQWIPVKIDLEKTYDRVRWEFIDASLQVASVTDFLIEVIMSTMSKFTMQVLWNGIVFVLRLIMASGTLSGSLNWVWLSRLGPALSHLRVDDALIDLINGLLRFQRVQNLRTYLGVPLFHEKVTNNTLQFVVEKLCNKLQSWDAWISSLVLLICFRIFDQWSSDFKECRILGLV
ncbi:hypothetical protein Golob_024582 [Gossypium lobatum]|uniref:Reverse transcriptase domain-containing protein n=1 Tax=Gossypium lobatum TaxID=34289 RepID=A0A7J8NGA6_9ROSI|nr:hypothetical protein [Gossypium lobatum]